MMNNNKVFEVRQIMSFSREVNSWFFSRCLLIVQLYITGVPHGVSTKSFLDLSSLGLGSSQAL